MHLTCFNKPNLTEIRSIQNGVATWLWTAGRTEILAYRPKRGDVSLRTSSKVAWNYNWNRLFPAHLWPGPAAHNFNTTSEVTDCHTNIRASWII